MMTSLNRRGFLAAGAALPFTAWLERALSAQPAQKFVRPDARSPQGVAMLAIYAAAVRKMKADPNSPRSWTFQWYTHWVPGSMETYAKALAAKKAAVAALYPGNAPNPTRDLANEMWSNCQAHGQNIVPSEGAPGFPPQQEDFFLPWHRLYVLYFEQIIREVSGQTNFALPYWDYSTSDPTIRGVIPPQFTMKGDPTFGPLYVQNRNPGVNQGESIEQIALSFGIPSPLSLDALLQQDYGFTSDAVQGFNQTLDFGLHGNIHVAVGTSSNMGAPPTAAGDPIFWMHHSNVDRLWASWNAGNHSNIPLNQTFVFADGTGARVVANLADVLDLANLNYTYDRLEPAGGAPGGGAAPQFALAPQLARAVVARRGEKVRATTGRIELSSAPVQAKLAPAPAPAAAPTLAPQALRVHAEALDAEGRIYLVVRDLKTDRPPGTLYAIYIDLPANPTAEQKRAHAVGAINFFHAHEDGGMAAGGHGAMAAAPAARHSAARSFDVTNLIQALRKAGTLGDPPVVTILPVGQPDAAAKPVVGDVSIVEI